ncbi:MAG TPA: hypothetical protein PK002_11685, partial [Cellvibrio sp.]|nr:hypothetical protein [Cellvibrio sp.]
MFEKAEFIEINEHFENIFNAAEATQIVFMQQKFRAVALILNLGAAALSTTVLIFRSWLCLLPIV